VLPPVLALAPTELRLDNEGTAVNCVYYCEPGIKRVMAPSAGVPERLALTGPIEISVSAANNVISFMPTAQGYLQIVVIRENVKVGNLLDLATIGELGDRADIEDAKTSLVVGLIGETLMDELVVVDRASRRFVVTSVLGGFQAGDIPNI